MTFSYNATHSVDSLEITGYYSESELSRIVFPEPSMTQILKRLCTSLVAVLAIGVFGPTVILAEDTIRTEISDDQIAAYIDEMALSQKIVTGLKVKVTAGKPTYDVTAVDDPKRENPG